MQKKLTIKNYKGDKGKAARDLLKGDRKDKKEKKEKK